MRLVLVALGLSVLSAGCQQPQPRLNAPPHGQAVVTSEMRETYTAMADNALLADMSVMDIHFVPHRPMLNELGLERLARLAALQEIYGGTIVFSSAEPEQKLIDARLQAIRDYLGSVGVSGDTVVCDLPATRGMDAAEAVQVKEAAFKPKKPGSSDPAPGGAATPAGKPQ